MACGIFEDSLGHVETVGDIIDDQNDEDESGQSFFFSCRDVST